MHRPIIWPSSADTRGLSAATLDRIACIGCLRSNAGIECSSHDFRHTFAIEQLKRGVDIRTVSKALGHSSVTVTEKYYGKWCPSQQAILDDALSGAWEKK